MATYLVMCCFSLSLLSASTSSTIAQGVQQNTTFLFNRFNATSRIKYVAAASLQSPAIRLTNYSDRLVGRAYFDRPVPMKRNGSVISFSTTFVFAMVPQPGSDGGNGVCFITTPTTDLNGAIASQYLGLVNFSSNGKDYNHVFAVEFDTIESVGVEDKDSNHVGIDLNGVKSVVAQPAGYWEGNNLRAIDMKSGQNIRAWIDYDGDSKQLDISIAPAGETRPRKPLLSKKDLDLDGIMEDHMYVGFSASTGDVFALPLLLSLDELFLQIGKNVER